MKTFAEFKRKMRNELWPGGEAKSLVTTHDSHFNAAMIDIQRWVPCVQKYNVTQFAQCARFWEDAKEVVDAPNGVIRRVYTVANGDWRDRVFYWSSNFHEINCWANRLYEAVTPVNANLPKLPHGFFHSEKAADSTVGRARIGLWAIHNHRLYIAPWLQSNEVLVVEWDGIKPSWAETDGVNEKYWTPDYEEAIKSYVRSQHEHNFGDIGIAREFKSLYAEKLSDLMWQCRENTRQQEQQVCGPCETGAATQEEIDDDAVPTETTEFTTVFIADWGLTGAPLTENIATIQALNPNILFFGGDNTYGQDPEMLFNLWGSLLAKGKPIWGNHDWDFDSDLSTQLALFTLPNNERVYEVIDGPVHYFILSTDAREPDSGYVNATTSIENGIMMQRLKALLALSTARWKVVMGHHAPYTSDVTHTPGSQWMRAPYKTWGADVYIGGHGHNAEFVEVADFLYVTNGIGGHSLRAFGASTSGTILHQYFADFGFLKIKANCSELKLILTRKDGEELFTKTLTKN